MKKILWKSTFFGIVLFMVSCSTIISSCSSEAELTINEVVNTNAKSEDVYNNFLASLEEVTTRNVKEYKYPDYFGGCFTNDKGVCVFLVVSKDSTEDVINDLRARTKSNSFSVEECEYSYSELEEVLSTIKSKLFDSNFNDTRESLKWHGCYLDSERNRVIVRLGECTDEYIKRFKATVSDSPMIEFIEGGKNVVICSSNEEEIPFRPTNAVTRAQETFRLGGSFYVTGRGFGSIGYRAKSKSDGSVGFITAGHVISDYETAYSSNSSSNAYSIGVCDLSIMGGTAKTDAAFVYTLNNIFLSLVTPNSTVLSQENAPVLKTGDTVSKEGYATGYTTGKVTGVNFGDVFTAEYPNKPSVSYSVDNLVVASYNSDEGDSGGVVYSANRYVVGIHMGSYKARGEHYYVRIGDALNALNVEAYN